MVWAFLYCYTFCLLEGSEPLLLDYMGLDATKPVFRVSDRVRLKQSPQLQRLARIVIISFNMILSNKRIAKALIRLGWSAPLFFQNTKYRFSGVEAHMVRMKLQILDHIDVNLVSAVGLY